MYSRLAGGALIALTFLPTSTPAQGELADFRQQVIETERAFAKTMADRDHDAFASFLSPETIFFGQKSTMRGRQQVADAWKRWYEGPDAPFSWQPESVEVLDSATLASSSGPVYDPEGKRIGTFNSIWRRNPDGKWRIIFDRGCPPCECP